MKKFKQLIYLILVFGLVRASFNYDENLSGTLNELISVFTLVVILTAIYWLAKPIKTSRNKSNSSEISIRNSVKPQHTVSSTKSNTIDSNDLSSKKKSYVKQERNEVGWYLFSAVCIGGLIGGGGGFFLANFTLELSEQASEVFGWVCAFALGVISFNKKWEIV